MSNNIDRQYSELVNHILRFGYDKKDRTGTGTKSIYGWQIRHRMSEGFPLLTTKKMAFKTMVTELLWLLRGDTNIKYLVDNECHIWDGDAWKHFSTVRESMLMLKPPTSEDKLREYIEWYEEITTKEQFINKIKTDDKFAKKWGELGPVYGKQWRSWGKLTEPTITYNLGNIEKLMNGIDQIADAINLLKTDPDSRRMIVNAWNVGELNQMVLPPCHIMFQFYTRKLSLEERVAIWDKKFLAKVKPEESMDQLDLDGDGVPKRAISLRWDQHSVDVGLSLPFNIASYALLLEIIAKEVNMVPEELIGSLGDCHIYNNHVDGLKEQLERIPYELPKLNIHPGILDYDLDKLDKDMFTIENYQSHPAIKLPLSN